MYKSLTRLKRNILEYETNTIIQCSAMDPEQMQTGTAKPAEHPEPETETNLQTGRRAQGPRRLHPETFTRSAPSTQEKNTRKGSAKHPEDLQPLQMRIKRPWNEKTRGKHRNTTPEDKMR